VESESVKEAICDPGNYAVLKSLAQADEMEVTELQDQTGISEHRLNQKLQDLNKIDLIEEQRDNLKPSYILEDQHRQKLSGLKEEAVSKFGQDDNSKSVDKKQLLEELSSLKKDLRENLENESLDRREKTKLRSRLDLAEELEERIQSGEDSYSMLEAQALYQRLSKVCMESDLTQDRIPLRDLKFVDNIERILESGSEDEDSFRPFFGNRWIRSGRF
jgi:DNA-binding HxlR family transcriptional regulator